MSNKAPLNVNFMAPRKILGVMSIILVVGSLILLGTRGLNLGMDFTGGTTVVVQGEQDIDTDQVREALSGNGFGDAVVQYYGSAREVSIRVSPREDADADKVGHQVFDLIVGHEETLAARFLDFLGSKPGVRLLGPAEADAATRTPTRACARCWPA